MLAHCPIYLPPVSKGTVLLGRTVPSLLDDGCDYSAQRVEAGFNEVKLHQWVAGQWQHWPLATFRARAEALAVGLISSGLTSGDRVGLLLPSDVYFGLADMACLLAGLVNIPLEVRQSADITKFILQDAQVKALIVADWSLVQRLSDQGCLPERLKLVVVVKASSPKASFPKATFHGAAPPLRTAPFSWVSLRQLEALGQAKFTPQRQQQLRQNIHPQDLATIVYTADATGLPKGVMLTHENLSADIWAAFSSMPELTPGMPEVALSFLPLTHIFARAFLYGHYGFGHDVYFSTPRRVMKHLAVVKPTIFITVPRLLEKVYDRFRTQGMQLSGGQGLLFRWGWQLAARYQAAHPSLFYRLQLELARKLVFKDLKTAFGGRIRYFLCGGAALNPDIMQCLNAAGLPVKQGYGLTETSSVLTYTRDRWNKAGTVGVPIPGVELRLGDDSEVLVKSPYTMKGYYHNPTATQAVLDDDGWFHTGDYGEFSEAGLLTLTGCKKDLFKLSTGKYVTPRPIELQLQRFPLIRYAVVVGPQRKFCGALIFPDQQRLQAKALDLGLTLPMTELLNHPLMRAHYQQLIDVVNEDFSYWSTVKRFCLLAVDRFPVEEVLDLSGQHHRAQIYYQFASEIDALYQAGAVYQEQSTLNLLGGTHHA